MSNTFFTSDTHFGHRNILKYEAENRPFSDTDEMDEALIANWNRVVGYNDIVFHLGDALMGDFERGIAMMQRLNGRKFLVPGNHDRVFSGMKNPAYRARFEPAYRTVFKAVLAEQYPWMLPGEIPVTLCHFPFDGDSHGEDRYSDRRPEDVGQILLHGHVHGEWRIRGRQFNVGVDVNNLTPVNAEEIAAWAQTV